MVECKLRIRGWEHVQPAVPAGNPSRGLEGMEGQSQRGRLGNRPHGAHC